MTMTPSRILLLGWLALALLSCGESQLVAKAVSSHLRGIATQAAASHEANGIHPPRHLEGAGNNNDEVSLTESEGNIPEEGSAEGEASEATSPPDNKVNSAPTPAPTKTNKHHHTNETTADNNDSASLISPNPESESAPAPHHSDESDSASPPTPAPSKHHKDKTKAETDQVDLASILSLENESVSAPQESQSTPQPPHHSEAPTPQPHKAPEPTPVEAKSAPTTKTAKTRTTDHDGTDDDDNVEAPAHTTETKEAAGTDDTTEDFVPNEDKEKEIEELEGIIDELNDLPDPSEAEPSDDQIGLGTKIEELDDLPGPSDAEPSDDHVDLPTTKPKPTKKQKHDKADHSVEEQLNDDLALRSDDELEEELHKEKEEARVFGGFGFLLALVAMVFTAHQMSDNPDGIYASLCRLAITLVGCVIKAVLMPCRSMLGHRYHGLGSVNTMDYREPYRNHQMELT